MPEQTSLQDVDSWEDMDTEECQECGGDGWVLAQEAECDYVNYGDDEYIVCEACDGRGYL